MYEEMMVLVDEHDNFAGSAPKSTVHKLGLLHRAFSVFIFNSKGQLLLQQRAFSKYHSPGLWTNTCCGHPRPGEDVADAAGRRLHEEMGMRCHLQKLFTFTYKSSVGQGMTEHELDHVLAGITDDEPQPNPLEAAGWKYMDPGDLATQMQQHPGQYTEWFKICMTTYAADIMAYKKTA